MTCKESGGFRMGGEHHEGESRRKKEGYEGEHDENTECVLRNTLY